MTPPVLCPAPNLLDAEARLVGSLAAYHPEWIDAEGTCPPCTEAAVRWAVDEVPG